MNRIFSTSILALVLLTACTPKDQKLERANNKLNQSALPGGQVDGRNDDYKHMLVLLDRSTEALNLFKVLTNKDYADQNAFTIEDSSANGENLKKISHISDKTSASISLESKMNFMAKVDLTDSNTIKKIVISDIPGTHSTDTLTLNGNSKFLFTNTLKQMTFTKTEAENQFTVEVLTNDELASDITGKSLSASRLAFNMKILDPETAESFEITKISLSQSRYGVQFSEFSLLSDEVSRLVIQLNVNKQCSSLNGNLKLLSVKLNKDNKPAYSREMKYTDSSVLIKLGKDPYDIKAADCPERNFVDLTKILN